MVTPDCGIVLRQLRHLVTAADVRAVPDRQLLDEFTRGRDEAAFAALVRRHGPLVLGVSRRVLRQDQDAEDVFQATFLVLARKAGDIDRRVPLAGWLYRVAYHIALKVRKRSAARQQREERAAVRSQTDPLAEVTGRELLAVLDEELHHLSDRDRQPVVLCYLQGLSRDEAARQLGCSESTLKRRLERAKGNLRARLARRGLTLPAALLTAGLASSSVPPSLAAATTRAVGNSAILSEQVVALVRGFLPATATRLRTVAALFLAAVLVAGGLFGRGADTEVPRPPEGEAPQRADARPAKDESKETVSGRILDSAGKPIAGANVAVFASPRLPPGPASEESQPRVLGTAKTDAAGEYTLSVPRLSSRAYWFAQIVASAPEQGLNWHDLSLDAEKQEVALRLERERPLRGRLVDLQGTPAAKVTVHTRFVNRPNGRGISEPATATPAWFTPPTTDAEGRFVLRGLGIHDVHLLIRDERFARQQLSVVAGQKDRDKEITFILAAAQVLTGRVTYDDTGKPAAGARLMVMVSGHNFHARADAGGRYEIPVSDTKHVQVYASPPTDEPYSVVKKMSDWPRGAARHTVDLALRRGVVVTGTVTESPSGKPVQGASVQFFPRQTGNDDLRPDVASLWQSTVLSGKDGDFRIVLPPGPAHLLVNGPTPDYVYQELAYTTLADAEPSYGSYSPGPEGNAYYGGQRVYVAAALPVKVKAGTESEPVKVTLRRGTTVTGRLLDADGKPVARAVMLSRLHVSPWENMIGFPQAVSEGRFTLHGCDPDATYRVVFYDAAKRQGAVAMIAGKQPDDKPVTVRLAPCGAAKVRLVDHDGKPVINKRTGIDLVVTPGPSGNLAVSSAKAELMADAVRLYAFDHELYSDGPRTDKDGRIVLPAVIPGATYRFHTQKGHKDFTAEGGKTADWGDVSDPVLYTEEP